MAPPSRPTIVGAALMLGALVAGLAIGLLVFRKAREPLAESVMFHLAQRDVSAVFHKRRLNFLVLGAQEDEGNNPPQDVVLVANATGVPDASEIVGDSTAAHRLAETFTGFSRRSGRYTVLRLGAGALPRS